VNTCLTFIIDGAAIIQRLVTPLAIVKDLDTLEDRSSRFTPGPERGVMDQFVFERTWGARRRTRKGDRLEILATLIDTYD